MTGPKEEWLIWDRRFQFGYSCLSQRLKTNEEATQQIAQFDQQIKQLAASTKRLQEENDGLRDRVQLLERASCQMARLDEQVQDLRASSKDLKEENSRLKDGILQLERGGCQMVRLDEQVQDLTASSRDLKEENNGLKDKILQLERGGGQMAQLDEQVQDLTASSRDLKQENNGFKDKMMQLEQEGTCREEENRQAQERLREKIGVQEGEFKSVVAAMDGMNEIARAERGKRGEEIQRLRAQVESLVATWHTPGRHVRCGKSGERAIHRGVGNMWHSITGHIPGHYGGRRHPDHAASPAAAVARRQRPRHRGPGRAHQGSSFPHALRGPPEVP